jgi:hypothetical protein
MDPYVLRDHLEKLHEELSVAQRVDPRSAQIMAEVMADIQRLLESPTDTSAAAVTAPTSLPDRLESIAVQFEARHPTLAASSRRLVDLLGKAGL